MKKRRWGLLILVIALLVILLIKRTKIVPPPRPPQIEKEVYKKPSVKVPLEKIKKVPRPMPLVKKRTEERTTVLSTIPKVLPKTVDTMKVELQVVTSSPEVVDRIMEPEERGNLELRIEEFSEGIKRERLGGVPYPKVDEKPRLVRATRPPTVSKNEAFVRALVETDGLITKTEIEKSSGDSHTDSLLLSTVKEFRFSPSFHKGNFIKVEILIPFEPSR